MKTRSQRNCDGQEGQNLLEMDDAHRSSDDPAENMCSVLSVRKYAISGLSIKPTSINSKKNSKEDMKAKLKDLKPEIYQKLSANSTWMHGHKTRLNEAEARIGQAKTVNMSMKDVLIESMKKQKAMLEKLTDLEGRTRRNNLDIYGVPEEKEATSEK